MLFEDIDKIFEAVEDNFKFTAKSTATEIKKYPAFVLDEPVKTYNKAIHVNQYYKTTLKVNVYILKKLQKDDENEFRTLVKTTLKRIFAMSGFHSIDLQEEREQLVLISGNKVRAYFCVLEITKNEYIGE